MLSSCLNALSNWNSVEKMTVQKPELEQRQHVETDLIMAPSSPPHSPAPKNSTPLPPSKPNQTRPSLQPALPPRPTSSTNKPPPTSFPDPFKPTALETKQIHKKTLQQRLNAAYDKELLGKFNINSLIPEAQQAPENTFGK